MHRHLADRELHLLQLFDRDVAREVLQTDGEKRCLHLPRQDRRQTNARTFITEDADLVLPVVGGEKKWQALDVIPVRVRDEEREPNLTLAKFALERETQFANS